MEHFVAIDNVCAWPNLTLLPDQTILATIYNQPSHAMWEGDVECWASCDGGRTWTLRGVPARHEPTTNRMNVAAGLAHDGSLVVLASGWSHRVRPGGVPTDAYCGQGKVLPCLVARSSDGARAWEQGGSVTVPPGAENIVPFGDIVRGDDGSLSASAYWGGTSFFYRSCDDGRTWSHLGTIASRHDETAIIALSPGRWLAAARSAESSANVDLFASEDDGETWTGRGPLSGAGQHPAHLLRLADGRVLVTYGLRNFGLYGVAGRLSEDDGMTWSWPFVLVNIEGANFDCGYPSSVQLADGIIVTAYYTWRARYHQRYHMGVLRWEPDTRQTAQWY